MVYVIVNERDKIIAEGFDNRLEAEKCIPPSSRNLRVKGIPLQEYANKKAEELKYSILRNYNKNQ